MARLTTAQRNALPSSDFAIPSKRAYPIEDAGHRKAAAARASEFGTPAVKAAVHRKIAQKRHIPKPTGLHKTLISRMTGAK